MEFILSAVIVFTVTNIDDIIILSLFFSDKKLTPRTIVSGQYLGIGTIVVVSALGALLASALPTRWIALLGLIPIIIGLSKAASLFSSKNHPENPLSSASRLPSSGLFYVTCLTIANGGDNIGLYIPIFSLALDKIYIYAIIFMLMTGFWCYIGYKLVSWPPVAIRIDRYGKYLLPVALILIGLHILSGAFVAD